MQLRRRNFLGLIGAAAAAPMMPMGASAAGYSRASYVAAIAHANKFPMVSIGGMIKNLGVTADQAEAILGAMDREGLVKILAKPSQRNGVHAASKVLKGDHWGLIRTGTSRPSTANANDRSKPNAADANALNADPMMAHLYDLCRTKGFALSERCIA